MDLLDLHAFSLVAKEKSISKASQQLHLTQPTVSARIKRLEQELGTSLFERDWSGVHMTANGRLFLYYALKTIEEMNRTVGIIQQLNHAGADQSKEQHAAPPTSEMAKKAFRIGISTPIASTFFLPILVQLKQSFPSLQYSIVSEDSHVINDMVAIGEIEIGIVTYFDSCADVEVLPLLEEEMVLVGSVSRPIPADSEHVFMIDFLLKQPFVLFNARLPLRQLAEKILKKLLGRIPRVIHEVNDTGLLKHMISNGLGYSILPTSFIFDSIHLFRRFYHASPLPQQFCDQSFPFNCYRLDSSYPKRTIYLVYSTRRQDRLPIETLVKTISAPYSNNLN
jgi:DNA-binding transcriptional LysR family regulator